MEIRKGGGNREVGGARKGGGDGEGDGEGNSEGGSDDFHMEPPYNCSPPLSYLLQDTSTVDGLSSPQSWQHFPQHT